MKTINIKNFTAVAELENKMSEALESYVDDYYDDSEGFIGDFGLETKCHLFDGYTRTVPVYTSELAPEGFVEINPKADMKDEPHDLITHEGVVKKIECTVTIYTTEYKEKYFKPHNERILKIDSSKIERGNPFEENEPEFYYTGC